MTTHSPNSTFNSNMSFRFMFWDFRWIPNRFEHEIQNPKCEIRSQFGLWFDFSSLFLLEMWMWATVCDSIIWMWSNLKLNTKHQIHFFYILYFPFAFWISCRGSLALRRAWNIKREKKRQTSSFCVEIYGNHNWKTTPQITTNFSIRQNAFLCRTK